MIGGNSGAILTRLLTALVLGSLALVLVWLPGLKIGFAALVLAIAAVGAWEYAALARARGIDVPAWPVVVASGIIIAAAQPGRTALPAFALCLAIGGLGWWQILRGRHSMSDYAASVFAVVYTGWFPAHFLLLHHAPHGPGLLTFLIVIIALSDTGAYFTGLSIGRNKMAPSVSPKKTWEGFAGGIFFAAAGAVVFHVLWREAGWAVLPPWPLPYYIGTGVLLALAGVVGDLVESMIKRDAGMKDSGNIFPGHGGALDRCDSLLFAGPLLYYLIIL